MECSGNGASCASICGAGGVVCGGAGADRGEHGPVVAGHAATVVAQVAPAAPHRGTVLTPETIVPRLQTHQVTLIVTHRLLERLHGLQRLNPISVTPLHVSNVMHSLAVLRFRPPQAMVTDMIARMLHTRPVHLDDGKLCRLMLACHALQTPPHVEDTATLLDIAAATTSEEHRRRTAATVAYACAGMYADDVDALATLRPRLQRVVDRFGKPPARREDLAMIQANMLLQAQYAALVDHKTPDLLPLPLLDACNAIAQSATRLHRRAPAQQLANAAQRLGWFSTIHQQHVVANGLPAVDVLGVLPDGQQVAMDIVLNVHCFSNAPKRLMGRRAMCYLLLGKHVGHVLPVMLEEWQQAGRNADSQVDVLRGWLLGQEQVVMMLAANGFLS